MAKGLAVVLAGALLSLSAYAAGVDVNTATAEELTQLEGVGGVIAARIVEEREAGGPFVNLEDLIERVSGVGESFLHNNSDRATASGGE